MVIEANLLKLYNQKCYFNKLIKQFKIKKQNFINCLKIMIKMVSALLFYN